MGVLTPIRVAPSRQEFSWSGPGSGRDAIAGLTDPLDEVRYVESANVGYPERKYRPHTTFTNWYADWLSGNDAWDGTSPTFVSGTIGPKKTWKACYDAVPAAGSGQINLVNLTQSGGVEWNEGEYINIGGTKTIVTVPYYLNVGRVIFDGRPPASSFTWTQESDAQGTRWHATCTSSHVPALNEGQANNQSTSVNFANQGARFATDIDGALASKIVTRLGVWIRPATSLAISSITFSTTTAIVNTGVAHNLATGDAVTIYGVDLDTTGTPYSDDYNGVFEITVTGSNTFTYVMPGNPGFNGIGGQNGMRWVSRKQVANNTFYLDNIHDRIYIGFDPSGQEVRAANLQGLFSWVNGSTHVMMGVVVRCYDTRYGGGSNIWTAMCTHSSALIYENNFFGFTPAGACGNGNTNSKIYRENHFAWCLTGSSATSATTNLLYWRSFGRFFNWQQGGIVGWHCGLHKSANVSLVQYIECQVEYSQGPGLWLDYASGGCQVINNLVHYCANFGISIEKCDADSGNGNTLVAGNYITDCLWGIGCTGTAGEDIYNNTIRRCGVGIRLFDDIRDPSHAIASILLQQNLIIMEPNSVMHGQYQKCAIAMNDGPSGGTDSELWFTLLDYNGVWVDTGVQPLPNLDIQHDDGTTSTVSYAYANWRTAYPALNPNGSYSNSPALHPLINPADFWDARRAPHVDGMGAALSTTRANALGTAYGKASVNNPGPGSRLHPGYKSGPIFLLKHTFSLADSAVDPGVADTLQVGTAHAGTFGRIGNKLYSVTDTDGDRWTVDSGAKQGWSGALIEGHLSSGNFRILCYAFAGIDANNMLIIGLQNGTVFLRKLDAGVLSSTLQTGTGLTTTNGVQYGIRVKRHLNTIAVYVDRALAFTHTLASGNAKYLDGTREGGYLYKGGTLSPGTSARLDNLFKMRL
jgi:hypothetical protein